MNFPKILPFDDTLEPETLRANLEIHGLVLARNIHFSPGSFIDFASGLGNLEPAWEDGHPSHGELQLLDSANRIVTSEKGSSRYWHSDRSFVHKPTRYTLLYAEIVEGRPAATEFVSTFDLANILGSTWIEQHKDLQAVHSFSKNFPRIMRVKGHDDQKIKEQELMYPDVTHPLVRRAMEGPSVYFSELCIERIQGVTINESNETITRISKLLEAVPHYSHSWKTGDLLVWDNFSTVHRAGITHDLGRRRLLRATIGESSC